LHPTSTNPTHGVACLLDEDARRRLWAELQAGRAPTQALIAAGLPQTPIGAGSPETER
jgi:hypothetical protein